MTTWVTNFSGRASVGILNEVDTIMELLVKMKSWIDNFWYRIGDYGNRTEHDKDNEQWQHEWPIFVVGPQSVHWTWWYYGITFLWFDTFSYTYPFTELTKVFWPTLISMIFISYQWSQSQCSQKNIFYGKYTDLSTNQNTQFSQIY